MRLVFFGTPGDAVPPLRALHAAGHEIGLVVTQPDRRRGRGGTLVPSPVKRAALELGLPVVAPVRAGEVVDEVAATEAELGVVVAFGQLLPPALLAALPFGFVNLHFSLLPRWRGAAPVERAILAGDSETGVCLMRLEEGLDTGPVYARERVAIGADETAGELRARLVAIGTTLLVDRLPTISGARAVAQVGDPTYAEKLGVEEFRLDCTRSVAELVRLVRAGSPRPGAWAMLGGRRFKVLRARAVEHGDGDEVGTLRTDGTLATVAGSLVLEEVQPEGKAPMSAQAWLAGWRGPWQLDA